MPKPSPRFGIGEWYGKSFVSISHSGRQEFARLQSSSTADVPCCPFLSVGSKRTPCWKKGGVCSLRMYEKTPEGEIRPEPFRGTLRVTCPSRFEQQATIYTWIGEALLGTKKAVPIGQVNFLERMPLMGKGSDDIVKSDASEEVGRIDNVLIVPGSEPLLWCPVEVQAVYFSGDNMGLEFTKMRAYATSKFHFQLVVGDRTTEVAAPSA